MLCIFSLLQKDNISRGKRLPMRACVSWPRIQVSSPDEADKAWQRQPDILTAMNEKDILNLCEGSTQEKNQRQ